MRIIYRRIRLFNDLQWYFEMGCEKSCFALSRFTLGGENSSFAFGCLVSEKVLRVCSCGQELRLCLWFNPSSALCALRREQNSSNTSKYLFCIYTDIIWINHIVLFFHRKKIISDKFFRNDTV